MNDNINAINQKLDHLMRVTAELFVMIKENSIVENKLDLCIKSLNTMNSSLSTLINNQNRAPPLPRGPRLSRGPPPKPLPPYKKPSKNNNTKKVSSGGYMEELKKKLKERNKKMKI